MHNCQASGIWWPVHAAMSAGWDVYQVCLTTRRWQL
jgi:hypothetical protein